MNFKLRVDGSWSDISGAITTKVLPYCEKLAMYQHPAEGEKGIHVHGLMYGWTKKEDTLRNVLKALKPQDAVKWSYECCQKQKRNGPDVDDGYLIYMSKGKIDPCLLKGWSSEYIDEQKAKWRDPIPIIETGKVSTTSAAYQVTVRQKKQTSEEKMNAWLVHECGWRLGSQFTINQLDAMSSMSKTAIQTLCNRVIRPQVLAYACGRVHNQQLVAMVRNALWNFSDDDVRDVIKENLGTDLIFS